ncbi:MAG: hypothetical protein COZ49_03920 [Candidatus Yonathbacteria bacterium CG_4_10_14_3_um_filter_47_65]|uniref:Uncharacterized protein n=2 Tax=Parcubacteria group TaxID=1794811 RepID=A0A2M8D7P2_9BACT|nr:MAG: hypothetical protein AUJ44_00290 [Candidatus Nomurabacteria bacterium CG1_02_47_685]PIP03880.1 MAG: hypothetical protein COX54_02015 [Candidatus Yonathbacteria bacterium CG23_combo_of_CG06-09_8_20_14_all_46_18]PIQ32815.1 MAG: hypothetical protein COW61_00830 [Candidatus Yonathbacteria bacterium CG17_big_fil_post_rev_8_21_14_2_50_46_19]PIX56085.1 MAG: hypothetical protein COZ49_03920 [Candidatus Yonathbacteria bacterium CG_4_10_14_3_um_filter_47_65]PIY57807.1 MAG: hypothetical protein CO
MNISKRGTIILLGFLVAITPFLIGLVRWIEDWFITIAGVIIVLAAYRLTSHDVRDDTHRNDPLKTDTRIVNMATPASFDGVTKKEHGNKTSSSEQTHARP